LQTKNFEGPEAAEACRSNLRNPGAKEDAMIETNVLKMNRGE
jgi:hypothetical protein